MDAEDFKLVQQLVGWSNRSAAERLGVAEVTIEKWRSGERTISPITAQMFLHMVEKILGERLKRYEAINRKYR